MIKKDSQGVELKVGQKVSYNLSGYVMPGTIERITSSVVYIRCTTHRSWYCGNLSRIKNTDAILVLRETDGRAL